MRHFRLFFGERVIYPLLILGLGCLFFWRVFLNPTEILFGKDTIDFTASTKHFISETFHVTGSLPFWNPISFGGKPFLGHGQEALFYPPSVLFYFLPSDSVIGFFILFHCILAGIGLYLLMGVWGLPPFPSFVSALTLMFSLKLVSGIYAGHLSFIIQAAWVPFAFLFLELTIQRASVGFALLTGLILGMAYLGGHVQVLFYLSFLLLLYLFFQVSLLLRAGHRGKAVKAVFLFPLIFVICLGFSSIQLLPFLEQGQFYLRSEGVDYQGPGQNHLRQKDLIRTLLPHYWGSPTTGTPGWFGNHLLETEVYAGILPLVLSIIAFMSFRKDPKILFWVAMVFFTLLFSLGKHTPFYPLFHSYIPVFGLFKTPPRMLWFYALSIAILAGFGTGALYSVGSSGNRKVFTWVFKGLGILCILILSVLFFSGQKVPGLTLCFSLLAVSFFVIGMNLKPGGMGLWGKTFLITILLVDLWFYGMPLVKTIDPQRVFYKTITATYLEKVHGEFRVLDLAGDIRQRVAGRYQVQILGGYDSSILKHFAEFYGLIWNLPNLPVGINNMPTFPIEAIQNRPLLNLLNARYITTENPIQLSGLHLVHKGHYQWGESEASPPVYIYENQEALPRAFVVRNARVELEKGRIFDALRMLDPKKTVILEEKFDRLSHPGEYQVANITSYQPNRVNIKTDLDYPGFLVLGDVWSPGWRAFDNGTEKKVFKANYALRSIFLEKGDHQVEFVYDPLSYRIGRMISLFTILTLLAYWFFTWRRNRA